MKEFILTALSSGVFTGVLTWVAARRKNLAEAQANELDNVEKAVKYYREMLDDMAARHKEAISELNQVNKLYNTAVDELNEARRELNQSRAIMEKMQVQIKDLAEHNRALLDELKKYKQLNGKSQ